MDPYQLWHANQLDLVLVGCSDSCRLALRDFFDLSPQLAQFRCTSHCPLSQKNNMQINLQYCTAKQKKNSPTYNIAQQSIYTYKLRPRCNRLVELCSLSSKFALHKKKTSGLATELAVHCTVLHNKTTQKTFPHLHSICTYNLRPRCNRHEEIVRSDLNLW